MRIARSLPLATSATEEQLCSEIAYYKARLADIRKAPESSRHRDQLDWVTERLRTSQLMLQHLQDLSIKTARMR